MHRVIDMAILIAKGMAYLREAYRYPKLYDENNPVIDRVGLQGDAMTVSVCTDNPMIDEDIAMMRDIMAKDGELLGERLRVLAGVLKEMDY